jgi:hypothetical protein
MVLLWLDCIAVVGRRPPFNVPVEMLEALVASVVALGAKDVPLVFVQVAATAPAEVTQSPLSAGICDACTGVVIAM